MDQPKMERLLHIMSLLANNDRYTINDLKARLLNDDGQPLSSRTVYRYIDTLKKAGLIVTKNERGYFSLLKTSPLCKEISSYLYFTDEECAVIDKLIDNLDGRNRIAESIRMKIEAAGIQMTSNQAIAKKKNAKVIEALREAAEEKMQVELLNYRSINSQTIKNYKVEPFMFSYNYLSILCYDIKEKKNKFFQIDRIGEVQILEREWKFEREHKELETDIFRYNSDNKYHIKLRLGLIAYNLITEEFPLSLKYITADPDDINGKHWILDTEVCSMKGVGRFVIPLMNDIEILKGNKLKNYVKDYTKKYLAEYLK